MAKKFSGLSRGATRPGKLGFGRRPAASPGLTAERRMTMREQFAAAIEKAKAKKKAAGTRAKRPPMPTGFVAASIKTKIEKLRKKEKWSFRERHGKTDFYEYLKSVYRLRRWAKRRAKHVAALYDIQVRKGKTPIRIVLDASCDQDRQVKSRWVIAIEYAVAKNVRKADFVEFLEKNGGPQGCARKMAALKKRHRQAEENNDGW
jgi:hypothetical protein